MMNYSGVTTVDLHARLDALAERQGELEWEQEGVAKQVDEIHGELDHRRIGTTDDRLDWQEVGLR